MNTFISHILTEKCAKNGCRNKTRTYDPLINSQLLYQLSYAATMDGQLYQR